MGCGFLEVRGVQKQGALGKLGRNEEEGCPLGPTGQAEVVTGSRDPEALLEGASKDFLLGNERPQSLQGQVRPGVMAVRCWGSEEGRIKRTRVTGQGESQKQRKEEGAGAKG